jgi:hypothetical protein
LARFRSRRKPLRQEHWRRSRSRLPQGCVASSRWARVGVEPLSGRIVGRRASFNRPYSSENGQPQAGTDNEHDHDDHDDDGDNRHGDCTAVLGGGTSPTQLTRARGASSLGAARSRVAQRSADRRVRGARAERRRRGRGIQPCDDLRIRRERGRRPDPGGVGACRAPVSTRATPHPGGGSPQPASDRNPQAAQLIPLPAAPDLEPVRRRRSLQASLRQRRCSSSLRSAAARAGVSSAR